MQQRRVRLGDIVDDYCPRERRLTNHAVVALIDDEVKQTRCATCDAEHEYKQAKVPAQRRRKAAGVLEKELADSPGRPRPALPVVEPVVEVAIEVEVSVEEDVAVEEEAAYVAVSAPVEVPAAFAAADADAAETSANDGPSQADDEWPVHRRLIRATLPRPEGQVPERKAPDFTIQPNSGRFDGNRGGGAHRSRGGRSGRPPGSGYGQGQRMSGQRQGGQGAPNGQRQGNRSGQPDPQRGGHAHGQQRHGSGRRRGR